MQRTPRIVVLIMAGSYIITTFAAELYLHHWRTRRGAPVMLAAEPLLFGANGLFIWLDHLLRRRAAQ